jgi:hypothetical protein
LNFCEISGLGAAGVCFEDALNAKLNFDDAVFWEAGPVGGALVGGGMSSSVCFSEEDKSSTRVSFEGRNGLDWPSVDSPFSGLEVGAPVCRVAAASSTWEKPLPPLA